MSDLIRFASLWTNTDKNGARYMSGQIDAEAIDRAVEILRAGGRLLVLTNSQRKTDRHPTAHVYAAPRKEGTES